LNGVSEGFETPCVFCDNGATCIGDQLSNLFLLGFELVVTQNGGENHHQFIVVHVPFFAFGLKPKKVNNSVYPIGQSHQGEKESANPDLGAAKIGEIGLWRKLS
jgi:hypothetical protein